MTERKKYTIDDLQPVEFDESVFESFDLSLETFKTNLVTAAELARDFARTFVTNSLPEKVAFEVHYGCSYDGNSLVGDEKTFRDDYEGQRVSTESAERVASMLWRDGFVPEWINVTVSHEDGVRTFIKLECCGRYSATPRLMYHIHEGRPPFHVLGPPTPPDFDRKLGNKFNLSWRKDG